MQQPIPVILIGVSQFQSDFTSSMAELKQLTVAANLKPQAQLTQNMAQINHQTYFGQGKIQELIQLAHKQAVQLVIVNDELTPAQLRNLEKLTQLNFLDRTELILQIFSQRAHSRQAQLQVKIAQLQYQLPRIHPSGNPLDQQRGSGLANRGTGESQLELNRRTIQQQITQLKHELQHLHTALQVQGQRQQQSRLPKVALVGYTNAGKSTTLNAILDYVQQQTTKQVLVKDQLFATLDTAVREIKLPRQTNFLLSDTVGFVSKLPHNLIEAFKSTLAQAQDADLLVQVIDAADVHHEQMIQITEQTLQAIGIHQKPMIYAYNKLDLVTTKIGAVTMNRNTLRYSAQNPADIGQLLQLIEQFLTANYQTIAVLIPYANGKIDNYIQTQLTIIDKYFTTTGTYYQLKVAPSSKQLLQKFMLPSAQKPTPLS